MSTRVDLAEFQAAYLAEVDEHLTVASAQLLAIETALRRGAANPRGVREAFRALHTIKGLSAMVGVEPVVAIAHLMETSLRDADRAGGAMSAATVDTLLQGLRAIEKRVRALAEGRAVEPPPRALLDALDALDAPVADRASGPATELALDPGLVAKLAPFEREQLLQGASSGRRALRVDFVPSPARAASGLTINSVRERVGALGEIVKVLPIATPTATGGGNGLTFALLVLTSASDADLAAAAGAEVSGVRALVEGALPVSLPPPPARSDSVASEADDAAEPQRRGVVRVDVARLDEAMERLSALVVTRFRLAREVSALRAAGADTRVLAQIATDVARQLRDLREAIVQVRMVPVAEVLERVPLLVRGLRRATGKLVKLEIESGRTELDKAVAERIFPAIVHLVRNAVDHALEPTDERRRIGKPEEGLVRITAVAHGNGRLELAVTDDGRGIDRAAVARRAARPTPTNDAELLDLLCMPGFSTREEASETSGRGMGMDIVRRLVIGELGGELVLESRPGAGTTFTMRVPLTIAIVDAFEFECAQQRFVVPVATIDEIVEVDPRAVTRGPSREGSQQGHAAIGMIQRRGAAIPLIDLERALGLGVVGTTSRKAMVVRRNGEAIAFAVDRMLGQQAVVVRPLEDPLVRATGIAGSTDLGDGQPTLVLDLLALGADFAAANSRTTRP